MKIIAYLLIALMILIPASAPARQAEPAPHFDGFAVYLVYTDERAAEVHIIPGYDCGLQAFDIRFGTADFKAESQYDLITGNGHIIAIGFETEMKQDEEYVIATVHFSENTRAEITRADFAIAHTPDAPAVEIRGSIWLDF